MPLYALFTFADLQQATRGQWVTLTKESLPTETTVWTLETDSRQLAPPHPDHPDAGVCFVPLVGDHKDGHAFISSGGLACQQAGKPMVSLASQAWLAQQSEAFQPACPLLVVEDTLQALQDLATFHRLRCSATVVALTGSSGKTTTKELLAHVLSFHGITQATEKNYNNDIGTAYTLLNLRPDTRFAVVEMGMRGLGQIRRLARMALPDVATVTNIGPAHIGLLGSLEAIACAKLEIIEGLTPAKGVFITNADDAYITQRLAAIEALPKAEAPWKQVSRVPFTLNDVEALHAEADGCYRYVWQRQTIRLSQPGVHQVQNALLIATLAQHLGMTPQAIAEALNCYRPQASGRYEPVVLDERHTVIYDAYNANPSSMQASLTAFFEDTRPTHRLLVLGTMQELGERGEAYHEALLRWLTSPSVAPKLQGLVFIGEETERYAPLLKGLAPPFAWHCSPTVAMLSPVVLDDMLHAYPASNWQILIKGSRSHGLEAVIETLKKLQHQM